MRRIAVAIVLLCACVRVHAAEHPIVRVRIDRSRPILVGQQVRVEIAVLVPNYFMSPLSFAEILMPNALVTPPAGGATNFTESVGDQTFAGMQQSLFIVPQKPGEFTLPPVQITFRYAAEPGVASDGAVVLPPEKFSATQPAGADTGAAVLPVAELRVTQHLDREPKNLEVGDALVRSIEAVADNAQAMTIPPATFTAPSGVRVTVQDPVLENTTDGRGSFIGGRRTERATYVFEAPGDYVLPAIELGWIDPASGTRRSARVPEIKLSIAANPSFKPEIAPDAHGSSTAGRQRLVWLRGITLALVVGAALVVTWWFVRSVGPPYRAWRAARRHAREESEAAYFARVAAACRANDAAGAYRALGAWTRRIGVRSIASEVITNGDAQLRSEIRSLERRLFAQGAAGADWDGSALIDRLTAVRKGHQRRPVDDLRSDALPALNP